MGLDRVGEVWRRLQAKCDFPVITVGGTNGKGSTCAMLESVYRAAGYRVACYTSPHILRYNERVRIDQVEAADDALCEAFLAVERARQGVELTYFEFGTLAAVWHFAQCAVDVAILEVGLGGRLDAVNIFEPACAIVTSIDLDHMDYLGDTRELIGLEKAGIYRPGVAAICGDEHPPSSLVEHARQLGADYRQVRQAFDFRIAEQGWEYRNGTGSPIILPMPALTGDFQLFNAACVIDAVLAMRSRLPVSEQHMRQGLQQVSLAGRFQIMRNQPLLVMDVAHNPHAAEALARSLSHLPCEGRTLAVFSMLADKDIAGVVRALRAQVTHWYIAQIHNVRAAEVGALTQIVAAEAPRAQVLEFTDLSEAFAQACREAAENDRIIVFGSFFTVAEIMQELA